MTRTLAQIAGFITIVAANNFSMAQYSGTSQYGPFFTHVTDSSNLVGNRHTVLDHPSLNGNPNAVILWTHNFSCPLLNNYHLHLQTRSIAVDYDGSKWRLYVQPPGDTLGPQVPVAFNILVAQNHGVAFVYSDTASHNGHEIYIDHQSINNNPNAVFLVAQNTSATGQANPHPIGVWYHSSNGKWSVFNEDLAQMPANMAFNVFIPDASANVYQHVVTASNWFSGVSFLDHSSITHDSAKCILVTQVWNPPGSSGVYNMGEVGVLYDFFTANPTYEWALYREKPADDITMGSGFNIMVLNNDASGVPVQSPEASILLTPNPASGQVSLRLRLDQPCPVMVSLVDMTGRAIRGVFEGSLSEGEHRLEVDTEAMPHGIYNVVVLANGETHSQKLVVVR